MKHKIHFWKLVSLFLTSLVFVLLFFIFTESNKPEAIQPNINSIIELVKATTLPVYVSENFKPDAVADGEGVYNIGSIVRIDGTYVDDQYFAYLWPKGSDKVLGVEISEGVSIKIFKNLNTANAQLTPVDIKTFRTLVRGFAKDGKASTVFYKIKILGNLIVSIEQVS